MCIRDRLKDAPIIILDEATANVDPENEVELQEAVKALTAGKTLVMICLLYTSFPCGGAGLHLRSHLQHPLCSSSGLYLQRDPFGQMDGADRHLLYLHGPAYVLCGLPCGRAVPVSEA